jgi:CRISPR system Cascade subunit CasB
MMSDQQREFALIKQLREWREQQNRAALATLRRGLVTPDSADVLRYVLPYIMPKYMSEEHVYILVAALFATHPTEVKQQSLGIEQRFVALLDADRDQVPVHLRHAVQLCQSRNIGLDYDLLLRQMLYWNLPQRYTQLSWARDFWTKESTTVSRKEESQS